MSYKYIVYSVEIFVFWKFTDFIIIQVKYNFNDRNKDISYMTFFKGSLPSFGRTWVCLEKRFNV